MKKVLFLDLEDTILDDFSKGWGATAMNVEKIKTFIAKEKPDQIRIFSFALGTTRDVSHFMDIFKPWLETLIGEPIHETAETIFTTKKLFDLFVWKGTHFEDELECMLFHGKSLGFLQFIRMDAQFANLENAELILLDDAHLEEMDIKLLKNKVHIRMVDVNSLTKE